MQMQQIALNYLKEKDSNLLEENKIATNSLRIVNGDIVLSGNKLGLIMLADYILSVALSDCDGYDLHLDQENFFDDAEKQLILELNK